MNVHSGGFTTLNGSVLTRSPFDPAAYDYRIESVTLEGVSYASFRALVS